MKHSLKIATLALYSFVVLHAQHPRITVVFVIDQLPYRSLEKVKSHFRHGFATLLQSGVVYTNAHHPHALPATATGHTALATGAFAKDHGVVHNSWTKPDGTKIECDDDATGTALVFGKNGMRTVGKSSINCMTDTLSDQAIMQSHQENIRRVFALSGKSRAAIACAGKLGKALWFDTDTGIITSSKAYFEQMPLWVNNFNRRHKIDSLTKLTWKPFFKTDHAAYLYPQAENYTFAADHSIFNTTFDLNLQSKQPYEKFLYTPQSNSYLLELGKACIEHTCKRNNPKESLLLWISLSSLDKVGHLYGPDSRESLDTLYHLDAQIGQFMDWVNKRFKADNVLYALSSDHGMSPIPELLKQQGLSNAQRINVGTLKKEINESMLSAYKVEKVIKSIKGPYVFLNWKNINTLQPAVKKQLLADIKQEFLAQPGIKRTWYDHELADTSFRLPDIEAYFQNQRYKGRSGDLVFQVHPYAIPKENAKGSTHMTPYNYDTHVPLILYQRGSVQGSVVHEKVWTLQLASTLAHLLNIPKPSACTFDMLATIT